MKRITILLTLFIFAIQVMAQDLPENAVPGKCYAKCYIPEQWKTVTEKVLTQEASKELISQPAKYETRTEKVLVKEASKIIKTVPAKYKTVTEKVLVKEAGTVLKTIPAKFKTRTEKVLIEEATTKWVKQKDAMCRSENSDDCIVWCLKEVPAQYKTVTKKVMVAAARTVESPIAAEYKTITKRVLVEPAKTIEQEVPAEYTTVTKRVLASAANTTEREIPAKYSTVTKRVLVQKGGFSEYREVVCSNKVTSALVAQVQRALIAKGYSVGPSGVDNVLGKDTRSALVKYQKDNGLPVGNLNTETLKSLGIKGY